MDKNPYFQVSCFLISYLTAAVYQFATGFFMLNSPVPNPNADAPSLIEHRFVICYAYYSIAAATEHGSILFLANYENPEWITDFEEAYFFESKEKAEKVVATLQDNFKANNFPTDSVSVILVNCSESD
ncbi:hypothetical protein [Microcoleus sp. N9_A1]|uniref:hypothetical protein n=1 Tax=Microcoleus sp. N9_A1 TaxID=3055380 RepID=UPI002FD5749A